MKGGDHWFAREQARHCAIYVGAEQMRLDDIDALAANDTQHLAQKAPVERAFRIDHIGGKAPENELIAHPARAANQHHRAVSALTHLVCQLDEYSFSTAGAGCVDDVQ